MILEEIIFEIYCLYNIKVLLEVILTKIKNNESLTAVNLLKPKNLKFESYKIENERVMKYNNPKYKDVYEGNIT